MRPRINPFFLGAGIWAVFGAPSLAQTAPLPRLHAHNDYLHARPLEDALEAGACSVEADIHLVDGKLLVAHDRNKVTSDRSLQSLYLDPLRKRAELNGGRIYPGGPEFILLVDIKGDADETWKALKNVLRQYSSILTSTRDGNVTARAVRIVLSGNRPRKLVAAEAERFAAIDGELSDLDSDAPADLIPQISAPWIVNFKWRGIGAMSDEDHARLKEIIDKAHAKGRRVRFWGTPESPAFLTALLVAGVDLLNVDDLKAAKSLLLAYSSKRE
jgi:glycerophosphoryl diester phosphodiesterase